MNEVVLVLLLIAVVGLVVALFVITQRFKDNGNQGGVEMLKTDVTELSRTIASFQTSLVISSNETRMSCRHRCRSN